MYLILNPNERHELEVEMRSRDELAVVELEFAEVKAEFKKSQKSLFIYKSVVVVLVVLLGLVLAMK